MYVDKLCGVQGVLCAFNWFKFVLLIQYVNFQELVF